VEKRPAKNETKKMKINLDFAFIVMGFVSKLFVKFCSKREGFKMIAFSRLVPFFEKREYGEFHTGVEH